MSSPNCIDDIDAPIVIAAMYKFHPIDPVVATDHIKAAQAIHAVSGTMIVADEGVNGTIAGTRESVQGFVAEVAALIGGINPKYSGAQTQPFHRFKIKRKNEIVTFHDKSVGFGGAVGEYVAPEAWNALIQQDDVMVIDTRNRYETQIGSFQGAVDPEVDNFMAFKQYLDALIDQDAPKRIAMFCTGGIRCEKSTGYAKSRGVEKVYHLEGGILNYLDKVSVEDSLWEGECFVFDHRVSVDHSLQPGLHKLCHSCGYPVNEEGQSHPHFEAGVSCAQCYEDTSEAQKERYRERCKQMALAEVRGEKHVGASMQDLASRKQQKKAELAARAAAGEAEAAKTDLDQ